MRTRAQSSGAALISALFLIIMLAALGVSMASLSTVQHDTASKSILSTKVYYGAKTGLEWGIQRAIAAGTCAGAPPPFTPAGSGFSDVSVTVTCAASQHGAGATSFTYHIVSEAVTGTLGTLNYAQRRMEATVSNIP